MIAKTPLDAWVAEKMGLRAEALTREAIARYQLEKLRETVRWARLHSPFHARLLDGVREEALGSLEDLARLPFSAPDDLRTSGLGALCVSQDEVSRVVTLNTSGTTGAPKRVCFTADDQELTVDFFYRGLTAVATSADRVLIGFPGERPGGIGQLLAIAIERLGATPVAHGLVTDAAQTLAVMDRERVTCIVGMPVQLLSLARRDHDGRRLRSVVLASEHVADAVVRCLKRTWGCEVFEHYGTTETGLGGGLDCAAHSGYHLREADLLFEIVDAATGAPVPRGGFGEVVFTTLTRRGMPFIRYRTGDLSRFAPRPCACGSALYLLERVRRRRADGVALGDREEISMAELDDALLGIAGICDFSAAIGRGRPTVLTVRACAVAREPRDIEREARDALMAVPAIQQSVSRQALELEVAVTQEAIEVSRGKRKIEELPARSSP